MLIILAYFDRLKNEMHLHFVAFQKSNRVNI